MAHLKMSYECGLEYLSKLVDQDFLTIDDFPLKEFFKDWATIKANMSEYILPPSAQIIVNNCKLLKVHFY